MSDSYPRTPSLINQALLDHYCFKEFPVLLTRLPFHPSVFVFLIFFSQPPFWCFVTFHVLPVDCCLFKGNASLQGWQGCICIWIFFIDEYDTLLWSLWYSPAVVLSDVIMVGRRPWTKHPNPQQRGANIRGLWRPLCLILQCCLLRRELALVSTREPKYV